MPYLEGIYTDESRKKCVEKSAQAGLTVAAVAESFHRTQRGLNWIYFFPTAKLLSKFVQGRYNVLISQNPRLAAMVQNDADNMSIKRIGKGTIYFSGLGSATKDGGRFDVISIPADGITYDEKELMIPAKVREAKERLAASPYGYETSISTPGLPFYGIDADFQVSDQKYWHIHCQHCGNYNVYDDPTQPVFPMCIEKGYLACLKCGKQVKSDSPGEWVAKYPDRKEMSGYHVTRLYSPFARLDEILEEFKSISATRDLKIFHNNVLGFPYVDIESRISAEIILRLCTGQDMLTQAAGCYMGIDIGDNKKGIHIVVLRQGPPMYQVVHLEILRAPNAQDPQAIEYIANRIGQLCNAFSVRRFCIDAMPQTALSRAIVYRLKGKGWMCRYNDNQKGPYKWGTEQEEKEVQVNRTESLDNWFYLLRNKLLSLPRRTPVVEEFAKHCENLVREIDEDEDTGKRKAVWKKIGPEDFAHAGNYAAIAAGFNGKPVLTGIEQVVKLSDDPFYRPTVTKRRM